MITPDVPFFRGSSCPCPRIGDFQLVLYITVLCVPVLHDVTLGHVTLTSYVFLRQNCSFHFEHTDKKGQLTPDTICLFVTN